MAGRRSRRQIFSYGRRLPVLKRFERLYRFVTSVVEVPVVFVDFLIVSDKKTLNHPVFRMPRFDVRYDFLRLAVGWIDVIDVSGVSTSVTRTTAYQCVQTASKRFQRNLFPASFVADSRQIYHSHLFHNHQRTDLGGANISAAKDLDLSSRDIQTVYLPSVKRFRMTGVVTVRVDHFHLLWDIVPPQRICG